MLPFDNGLGLNLHIHVQAECSDKVCKCADLYEHLLLTWATRSVFIWIIQIYIKIPCSRDEVNTICYPWSIRNSLLGAERNYKLYTIQTKVLIRWLFCLLRAYPNLLTPKGNSCLQSQQKYVCWKLLQTLWTQIRPDKMSGLIWIKTVWHYDRIQKRSFRKSWFWKKNQQATIKRKKIPCLHVVFYLFLSSVFFFFFFFFFFQNQLFWKNISGIPSVLSNLDPDQNVGPDLNQNCLTLWWYSRKNFAKKKNDYLRKMQGGKKHENQKVCTF